MELTLTQQQLLKKIEKTKNELARLKNKRRMEIGALACKHGLDAFEDTVLETHFLKLAQTLSHDHANAN